MNVLDLFSGAGGGILGSVLLGHRVVCAVERDSYCREILLRRQEEGHLPAFPIWDDVRTFDGKPWRGVVDIVAAGFPCQPFSVAGKRRGEDDERNCWPDTIRIIREVEPRYVLLENVPGLAATDYFGRILGDLADAGLDAEWDVVSAADVGAPHIRKRLWILAYSRSAELRDEHRRECGESGQGAAVAGDNGENGHVADAIEPGSQGYRACGPDGEEAQGGRATTDAGGRDAGAGRWWDAEPAVGRVAHGLAYRMEQLRALGNGQVPLVAATAWRRLMAARGEEVRG